MPTADDLFPIIVYCLIGANPSYLEANVNFISNYLGAKKRLNREGFVLTNLVAAIAFLKKLDGTALLEGEVKLLEEEPRYKKGAFSRIRDKHKNLEKTDKKVEIEEQNEQRDRSRTAIN